MLRRRAAGTFDDLFDIGAVEALLGGLARQPSFGLVRDGATLPAAEVHVSHTRRGADVDDVADLSTPTPMT